MIAVIGNGLVGKRLQDIVKPDAVFTSANIHHLKHRKCTTIYCAAPTGNRITANANPEQDRNSVDTLIRACSISKFTRFVLISTGDTQVKSDSVYGKNRLKLEAWAKQLPNSAVIRLPSLIHATITKNILYDIKHGTWLDKINPNNQLQWFDLDCLGDWIYTEEKEFNVCSEPILAKDIIDEFAPAVLSKLDHTQTGDQYDLQPYSYTKEQIFSSIRAYLT
jgi:hypothetical protein